MAAPTWKTQKVWSYTLDRAKLGAYKPPKWYNKLNGFVIQDTTNPKNLICFDKLYLAKELCEKNDKCIGISQQDDICAGNYSMAKGNKVKLVGVADWQPKKMNVYLKNTAK